MAIHKPNIEAWNISFPYSPPKELCLLTTRSWASTPPELLENKFLILMPPSLWYFVTEALTAELQTKRCWGCRGLRSRVLLYSSVEYKLVQPLCKTVWHHLEMSIWGLNNSTPRYVFLDYCCWIEISRMMEMCQKWCCPILLLSVNGTGDTVWLLYTWNVVNTTKRLHF